ncbi:MAG: tRNA dihydrouridine synthase [Pseudomonadales bacterium]
MSKIMLAPMEGVVDANMRRLLTSVGGIDECVTEFVRITSQPLPQRELLRMVPELRSAGKTESDVPVIVQFLGSDASMIARSSLNAVALGALGIDLNFGCPSKTVNKHRGGAVLLDEPETIHHIVSAVREAVPAHIPVSAKMRLGNKDKSLALDNALAIESAGASSLVIHARTKIEGYRPPAHWHWIAQIKRAVNLPLVANGDIWNWEDYQQCREASECEDVMIGRGVLANPALALQIKQQLAGSQAQEYSWAQIVALIIRYYGMVQQQLPDPFVPGRIKQWLNMMRKHNPSAQLLFDATKRVTDLKDLTALLEREHREALKR